MSQRNTGRQYNKLHAITMLAAVALAQYRFAAYDGGYATSAGGAKDCQGITETAAEVGDPVSVVTSYSYLVQAGEAIAFGGYVKPGANGVAMVGTAQDHCGRALGAATAVGQLIEVQIVQHVRPAA